jgi:polyvinyl alcohol dehydrogenase (cytochrome)
MQRCGILVSVVGMVAAIGVAAGLDEVAGAFGQWRVAGQNLANTRSAAGETQISPANVASLAVKWSFTTGGDVSATPTVFGDTVFVTDWAGNVYALDRKTGSLIWQVQVPALDGVAGAVSRSSPAVHGDDVIIGDIENDGATALHNGANLIALNRQTGKLHWISKVDDQGAAIITGSPVVFGNTVYVGISSNEEILAIPNAYACCTFRGCVVAVDANTGKVLWKTYTIPDNGGKPGSYSGGPVWQPPAIDPERGLLYIGTGNNYEVPASVTACVDHDPTADCTSADDHFNTAMALDLKSGRIRWSYKVGTYDAWTVACFISPPGTNCPAPPGPDYDLSGSGPNLLNNLVVFGQKSGFLWAFDPEDGTLRWSTAVGPGGIFGGIEWGTATDGKKIYVAISNSGHVKTTLINGQTVTSGFWNALDAATGKILWQTPDPDGAADYGAVSEANGVVYAGSLSGKMYALDAKTGAILWHFTSASLTPSSAPGSVIDGPSIVNGVVYWGSGYGRVGGTGGNQLYAFTVPKSAE